MSLFHECVSLLIDLMIAMVLVKHWNGRKQVVAIPPKSSTKEQFYRFAQELHWIEKLLLSDEECSWLAEWIANKHPCIFNEIMHGKR